MRSLDEVMKTGREESPFSNGTEGEIWFNQWCYRCHNPVEKAWQDYESGKRKTQLRGFEGGCPLLMASYVGVTPTEWLEQEDGSYHCIEFRGPDDGDGEPKPKPEPPNMDGLFERPERRTRMLTQTDVREAVTAQ